MPEERPHFSDLVNSIDHLKSVPQNKPLLKIQSATYLPVYS